MLQISGPSPPTDVAGIQDGPTSIRVTWTPPSPLGDTTGYRIHYSGGNSGSEDVSGGDTMTHTLTGLTNGETYTISIAATSNTLTSDTVMADYPMFFVFFVFFQVIHTIITNPNDRRLSCRPGTLPVINFI